MFRLLFMLLALAPLALTAAEPLIVTTILPETYLVKRIIGAAPIRVLNLLPAGQSPHDYQLTPRDLALISQASAWFTIGLPFENALSDRLAGNIKIFPAQEGVKFLSFDETSDGAAHSHNDEDHDDDDDDHDHAGMDPHIWLDPTRAQKIAENLRDGLSEIFPAQQAVFTQNAESLIADLQKLDQELARDLAPWRGKKIIVYHPAFGYFCARYGITQVPIELGGKSPSAAWLGKVIATMRAENIKTVFVQPQFNRAGAQAAIAPLGGTLTEFDPLPENYLEYLRQIGKVIAGK
jgi:zinc transport system substrate-binding protein